MVDVIRPIGNQAAVNGKGAFEVDRRQFVSGRKRDDQFVMNVRQRAPGHMLVAVSTSRLSCKRAGKTRTLMPVWDSSGESRLE